jgi:hypothetical protein
MRVGKMRDGRRMLLLDTPREPLAWRFSSAELDELRRRTQPVAGRDGWRVDSFGREWYSSEWLGLRE